MSLADDPELRALFDREAGEQLEHLTDGALALEAAPDDPALVADLFRDAHTLKSSASLMGFAAAGALAHGLEDLLGELRAGERRADAGVADALLRVVDALRALCAAGPEPSPAELRQGHPIAGAGWAALDALAGVGDAAAPALSEREQLDAWAAEAGAAPVGGPGPSGPEPGAAAAVAATTAAGAPRVASYEDAVFRKLFADEVGPELDRLLEVALELEDRGPEPELVAKLFRGAHSLKGSAAVVGFGGVSALAHRLEDRLSELRDGVRAATPVFVDSLLTALDAIRAATPLLVEGLDAAEELAPGAAALDALDQEPALPRPPVPAPAAAAPTARAGASAAPAAPGLPGGGPSPTTSPPEEDDTPAVASRRARADAAGGRPSGEPAPGDAAREAATLVPVGLDRLDLLVRLTGEAIAAHLRLDHALGTRAGRGSPAEAATLELRRVLGTLQEQALQTRMTTLAGVASNLRRAARDVARAAGKEVDYRLEGDRVELDRAVLDGLRDPLLHLVRNAVDHGVELPDLREARGKPRRGSVRVRAGRRGSEVVITVTDDGRGLDLDALRAKVGEDALTDEEAADVIFRPGLSTARQVTDVSGRGVGLDAVRTGVEALRGRVEVRSEPGEGCTFTVAVPLTLAVLPCVTVQAGGERYHLPVAAAASLTDDPVEAEVGLEGGAAIWVGPEVVPICSLAGVLGDGAVPSRGPALVLESTGGGLQAFRVDAVLGQRDVTVKELGGVVPRSPLVTGASIEADGAVVLVLDPIALVDRARRTGPRRPGRAVVASVPASPSDVPAPVAPSVLVVDDAMTVRELQRSILERAGFRVRVAVDGEHALALLAEERPDVVVSDVEMPRLDGYALVRTIRDTPSLASVPVLMVTSRASEGDRRRGLEAGADAYLVKQDFDEPGLLRAVGRLLGEDA